MARKSRRESLRTIRARLTDHRAIAFRNISAFSRRNSRVLHLMPPLAYILSLPRSGSTVLTSLLDQRRGVISPPESSFPQLLGMATKKERADPRWLAALYIASTFPGTPLSLDEAAACMKGTDEQILIGIGRALALKLGRNPAEVAHVVWKTTRTISLNGGPLTTGGRFIILRRHPHNIFESQFRVHFGLHNRKPFRFAAFRQSYEWAFARIPIQQRFDLDYEEIPARLPMLLEFLGVEDQGLWPGGSASLRHVAENRPWLSEILKEFRNDDAEKRARLDPSLCTRLDAAMRHAHLLRPLMPALRWHFDRQSTNHIRSRAKQLLASLASQARTVVE